MDGRFSYSEETRRQVARLFALGHGARAVATYLGLPHTTMRQWQDAYRQGHLLHSGSVREIKIYPEQLKLAAVEKFLAGTPKTDIVLEFGISARSLFDKWVAAYRKDGPSGLVPKPRGRKPSVMAKRAWRQRSIAWKWRTHS
jgi:transposase